MYCEHMSSFMQGQILENACTYDLIENFEDFSLKIGIQNCPNEYMKLYEYKRSRSFFNL